MPRHDQTPEDPQNPRDERRAELLRTRRDDPEGHLQIHVRDLRLPDDAPLIRIGRGEGERYRADVRDGHLVCPDPACDRPLMFLRAGSRRDHVAHRQLPSCGTHTWESIAHEQGKRLCAQLLRRSHPERTVTLEVTLPDRSRRADVYMDGPAPVAIEVQGAALSVDELAARRADYARAGVRDHWVFICDSAHVRPARVRAYDQALFAHHPELWTISDTAHRLLHDQGGLLFFDADRELLGYVLRGAPECTPHINGILHGADYPAIRICWAPIVEVTHGTDGRFDHPVFDAHREDWRQAERERRCAEEEQRRAEEARLREEERLRGEERWLRERAFGEQLIARGREDLFYELVSERLEQEAEREKERTDPDVWSLAGHVLALTDPSSPRDVFGCPQERVNTWDLALDATVFVVRVIECLDDLSRGGQLEVPTGMAMGRIYRRCYPARCPEKGKLRRELDVRFARRVERREVAAAVYSVLRRLRSLGLIDYDCNDYGSIGDALRCVALTPPRQAADPGRPLVVSQSL